jgi:hypothetical protein
LNLCQPFFAFFYERENLVSLIHAKAEIMYEILAHRNSMRCDIIDEPRHRVAVHVVCALDSANAFFLDELFANRFDFALAHFAIIQRRALGLNKIFAAMKAKVLTVTGAIRAALNDIFSGFSTIILAFLILTDDFILAARACHDHSPHRTRIKELLY